MLLIKKFHDYYDTALGYGVDKSIVYKRKTEKRKIDLNQYFKSIHSTYTANSIYWGSFGVISFCGKLYPFRHCEIKTSDYMIENIQHYIFDPNYITSITKKRFEKHNFDRSWNYYTKTYKDKRDKIFYSTRDKFSLIQEEVNTLKIHHELKCPVLQFGYGTEDKKYGEYTESNVVLNPCLKDFGFQRVIDPYTAFQEISMFISGVLGGIEKDTINISDTDMRDAKGFNDMSFKKYPTKKR